MSQKEAGIKLTLNSGGYRSGLGNVESDTKRTAGRLRETMRGALSDGVKAGADALKGSLSRIKDTVTTLGGLVSGIGAVELTRGALQAEGAYRALAFRIRAGTGEAISFRDIQAQAHRAALDAGQSSEDLARILSEVYGETGDANFARESIDEIATAATGAHEPVETLGAIAGTLNEKFGITSDEIGEALARVVSLGNRGGVSVGDLGDKLGLIGAYAKEAGLQGQEGFSKIVALMNMADDATGNLKKGITAVGGIMEQLGNAGSRNKAAGLLGIDPRRLKGDVTQQIGEILKATSGKKDRLERVFGGESLKLLVDMGRTYAQAFAETEGSVKAKTAAGLAAYEAALGEAGKSQITWADLQKEAASEMETSERKMAVALEKLRQAFARPEITEAVTRLIAKLPELADKFDALLGFAVKHPALAAGAAGGAQFAGVAATAIVGKGIGAAFDAIIGAAFKKGGQAAAAEVATGLAGAAAKQAGGGIASAFGAALLSGPGLALIGAAIAGYFIVDAINEADKERQKKKEEAADTGGLYFEGGGGASGNDPGKRFEWRRDEKGQLVPTEVTPEELLRREQEDMEVMPSGKTRAEERAEQEAAAAREGMYGSSSPEQIDKFRSDFYAAPDGGWKKPAAAGSGGMTPEMARLFAEMMAGKKLKVEVTNPEAIRGAAAPSTATPAPGHAKRT